METVLNYKRTHPCSCGKKMVRVLSRRILASNPGQHQSEWMCKCGHKIMAENIMCVDQIDQFELEWKEANVEVQETSVQ